MRSLLLLSIPLALLLLAACGGGGDEQALGPVIQDPEAVALQPSDMPVALITAGEGGIHVTVDQACASATDATERQACIDRLNSWGRRDHYQVTYASTDPQTLVSGVFQLTEGVSIYETLDGAHASFKYNVERLQGILKDNPDTSLLQAETIGDESVTWVNNSTQTLGGRDVDISSYVVDFRRGNTIVRVQMAIAKALGSVDEALAWARRADTRILHVSGWEAILATPGPTATAGP